MSARWNLRPPNVRRISVNRVVGFEVESAKCEVGRRKCEVRTEERGVAQFELPTSKLQTTLHGLSSVGER